MATTRGVHLTPIDVCMEATDEIKRQKFGNDYQRFVAWWREHKPDEHRKLEIEERR